MDIDRDIANKLQFCNKRNVNNNLSENDTGPCSKFLDELMVLNIDFFL